MDNLLIINGTPPHKRPFHTTTMLIVTDYTNKTSV